MSGRLWYALALAIALCLYPRSLYAQYIDPGGASLLWQLLLSGLLGVTFVLRQTLLGIVRRIGRRPAKQAAKEP